MSLDELKKNLKRIDDQSGLTLIELMVSMVVFLVVSAGVATTLTAGLRTTMQTRIGTMGKAVAQEQIEEMRSRVFFVPFSANVDVGTISDVDLLDKYYPNLVTQHTTDSEGWEGWYTSNGVDDAYYTKVKPADVQGITRTTITRFIDENGNTVIPQSNPAYDSNVEGSDTPPSELVSMTVRTGWTDARGEQFYDLNTIISATGQTVQGAGDASGEEGCNSTSNNYVDAYGGTFEILTGTADPYTEFIDGNFGEAHAAFSTGCDTQILGSGTGGKITVSGNTSTGADVSATAPPETHRSAGPTNYSQVASWPQWTITSSKVEGEAEDGQNEREGEGEASVGGMTVSIQEVDGWPGGTVSGYQRWDFVNPIVEMVGGIDLIEDDPDHMDDQTEAEIEQEEDGIEGEGEVYYQQINIMPLQAKTDNTPSASQGLIIIKNFNAEVEGKVGSHGHSPNVYYSGDAYLFNSNGTCYSESCGLANYVGPYHFYGTTSSAVTIQSLLSNLINNDSRFRLEKALITEIWSPTKQNLTSAISYSASDDTATFSLDAMLKISAKYGDEVRMETSSPYTVSLINQKGLMKTYLGSMSMSLALG